MDNRIAVTALRTTRSIILIFAYSSI